MSKNACSILSWFSVPAITLHRRPLQQSLGYTTRYKPLLCCKNKMARFQFANKYLKEPAEFWKKVLWTDETKIYSRVMGSAKYWLPWHSLAWLWCSCWQTPKTFHRQSVSCKKKKLRMKTRCWKLSYSSPKELIEYAWPNWKPLRSPITFGPLKWGGLCIYRDVIPRLITWYGCQYLQMKGDSLHFELICVVSFQNQCAGVRSHKNRCCCTARIRAVFIHFYFCFPKAAYVLYLQCTLSNTCT